MRARTYRAEMMMWRLVGGPLLIVGLIAYVVLYAIKGPFRGDLEAHLRK